MLYLENGKWYDESGEEVSKEDATTRAGLNNVEPVDIDEAADEILEQAEWN